MATTDKNSTDRDSKNRSRNLEAGFTLIELMIVIAIIGILAAIAVPNFLSYRQKGYDASANADIKNAFTAAQAYFSDYQSGSVSTATLQSYGLQSSPLVTLSVVAGTQDTLSMTAFHGSGTKTYTINETGVISF